MNANISCKPAKYLAATVLVTVAIIQFIISKEFHVSPWKGGGFGMFSTVSSNRSFFFRAYYKVPDSSKKIRVVIPAKYLSEEEHITYYPFASDLEQLKNCLLKEKWVLSNNEIVSNESNAAGNLKPVIITNMDVELWQYKFNAGTSQVYTSLVLKL